MCLRYWGGREVPLAMQPVLQPLMLIADPGQVGPLGLSVPNETVGWGGHHPGPLS